MAVEVYPTFVERDKQLTAKVTPCLQSRNLSAALALCMFERAGVRVALLDLLEVHPALAKLGKPDWVDELSHKQ